MTPDGLAPYRPGVDRPFGFDEVAHLFRRGGFGLPADEVEALAKEGIENALERLFTVDEGVKARALLKSDAVVSEGGLPELQALWLLRMVTTQAPVAEKLALFWHGHFATSFAKVQRADLMWRQYRLFREKGLGSFRELLLEVSRDPAMLLWLDSNSNQRIRPNENFARELMELFSLGVGHYRERDIQEAARAFTGWHVKNGDFWFNARAHDDGEKELFGRHGGFDGGDVVDLCVQDRNCPRFLAAKLLRFYVVPEPTPAQVEGFAALLTEEEFVLERALRRLFASQLFFSPSARAAAIKSPVDYVVGALRATRARASMKAAAAALAEMDQALFAPPNVKGWDGDRAWITSTTLLARGRFAGALAFGDGELGAKVDWESVVPDGSAASPERLVDGLWHALVQMPVGAATRDRLVAFTRNGAAGEGVARTKSVAHLILTAPEAQAA